jgi:hypothetical protein
MNQVSETSYAFYSSHLLCQDHLDKCYSLLTNYNSNKNSKHSTKIQHKIFNMFDFWSLDLKGLKTHSLKVQMNSLSLYKNEREECVSKTLPAESSQITDTHQKTYKLGNLCMA